MSALCRCDGARLCRLQIRPTLSNAIDRAVQNYGSMTLMRAAHHDRDVGTEEARLFRAEAGGIFHDEMFDDQGQVSCDGTCMVR